MFKLTLRPELSFPNAIIMTILFLGFCTFCGWLWQRYGPKKYAHLFLNLLLTLLGIIFIVGMIFGSALTHDEIEHAHAGWLVYKGLIPFTDFFQHHNPVLWIILAPLFKSSFISNNIFLFVRILATCCSLVSVLILIKMTKYVWQEKKAVLLMFLFVMSITFYHNLNLFRPDVFSNVFNLAAFYLLLTRNQKYWACFLAGLCLGISLSFSPKSLPLVVVLPLLSVIDYKKFVYFIPRNIVHFAGILTGLAPLILWLKSHQLFQLFYYWVFHFNLEGKDLLGKKIQLDVDILFLFITLVGIYFLFKSNEQRKKQSGKILSIFLIVSAITFLKPYQYPCEYYQQMFFLVAAVAASGALLVIIRTWFTGKKTFLLFPLIGLLIWPSLHNLQAGLRSKRFFIFNKQFQNLQKIARDETVICCPPAHPVTNFDAVDITNGWEYIRWLSIPVIQERVRPNFIEKVISAKPAVIMNKPQDIGIVQHLQKNNIITPEEAVFLNEYLSTNYHLTHFDEHLMWVRNDRYEWYQLNK